MLAALIRPVESHTVEVAGASLDDVYAQISSHAPDGFDLVSAPVRMLKGTAGIQATARLLGQTLGAAMVRLIFGLVTDHGRGTIIAVGLAAGAAALAGVASGLRRFTAPQGQS